MPELYVNRVGRTLVPANAEAEELIKKIPERRFLKAKVNVPRNAKTHDLFFAILADVIQHWPHGAEPHPEGDTELLRAWLLCRVGHCNKLDFPMMSDPKSQQRLMHSLDAMITRLRNAGEYQFMREGTVDGEPAIRVFIPKSISKDSLDETEFRPIEQAVFDEIEAITGIEVNTLIEAFHARKAAEAQARAA